MRETDMDTVLLFGGRSFLGGHICRALVKRGYRVLLHSTSSGNFRNLSDVIPDVAIEAAFCGFGEHEELRRLWVAVISRFMPPYPIPGNRLGSLREYGAI
jgi:nucleoside-diphosphate-sugar epimerase